MNSEDYLIDALVFARQGGLREGSVPLVRFSRAMEGLQEQAAGEDGLLRWSARGQADSLGRFYLHIGISANVVLECQRCLRPFVYPVRSEAVLQLVSSPEELDGELQEGEELDPLVPEKVLGHARFDLFEQVEDELVLSLPYVPKHEICPDGVAVPQSRVDDDAEEDNPSPFAALVKLKNK